LLIFSKSFGNTIEFYPVYLLLGVFFWNLFTNATSSGMESTENRLIKSIKFPSEALVISAVLSYFVAHLFEIGLLVILLVYFSISPLNIIFYIVLVVFFFIFLLGISFFLASVNLFFRDINPIWKVIVTSLLFFTPIFYSVKIGGPGQFANLFNPLYYFITAARSLVIYSEIPDAIILLGVIVFPLISILIGYIIFNKLKIKFAELI
jgi:ABC-type polysaccharide/polyol phosphate export permease